MIIEFRSISTSISTRISISLPKCFHITSYLSLHKTFGHSKVVSLGYFTVIFLLWFRCFFFVNQGCGAFSVLRYFSCEFFIIFFSWVYFGVFFGGGGILVFISSLIQSIKYTYMRRHWEILSSTHFLNIRFWGFLVGPSIFQYPFISINIKSLIGGEDKKNSFLTKIVVGILVQTKLGLWKLIFKAAKSSPLKRWAQHNLSTFIWLCAVLK